MLVGLSAERIREESRRGHWRNETLAACLDRWATRRPEAIALVDSAGRLTWGELARAVDRVACGLGAHGVGPGTFVSCQLPNWIEFALVFLAAERLGAVINPIPPTYRASELRFMLGLLETSVLVIPAEFRSFDYTQMVRALRRDLPRLEHVFVSRGQAGPDMKPFARLTSEAWEDREGRRPFPGTNPNIPVAEVENLLFAHPKVQGIAIVAMPDPRLVERACAFVIPRPGHTPTLGELTAYLDSQGIAKHKFPERLELVSEFPMTPSGKIQKYRLRQRVADALAREHAGSP